MLERVKKALRGIARALENESNKEIIPESLSGYSVAHMGMPVAPVVLTRDKAVNPTQLEFEKNGAIIHGAPEDVSAVRRFDSLAGRKLRAGKLKSLAAHSEDLRDVFGRVSARKADGTPVRALRYEVSQQTPGGRAETGLTIRLGRSS